MKARLLYIRHLVVKIKTGFIVSTGILLTLTAWAKVVSALGSTSVLSEPDPIFYFIPNRFMLLLAAGLELSVVGFLAFANSRNKKNLEVLIWLGAIFLLYRAGLWASGYDGPCSCLGTLTANLGVDGQMADRIMLGVLGYLLIPTLLFYVIDAKYEAKSDPAGTAQECGL